MTRADCGRQRARMQSIESRWKESAASATLNCQHKQVDVVHAQLVVHSLPSENICFILFIYHT